MPVEVEDGLPCAWADVDDDAIVVQPLGLRNLCDEVEHPLVLVRRELLDLAERVDMALRDDEQVRLCLRVDVLDCDEALGARDVVALADELAQEAVGIRLRQRGSPPRRRRRRGDRKSTRLNSSHRTISDAVFCLKKKKKKYKKVN